MSIILDPKTGKRYRLLATGAMLPLDGLGVAPSSQDMGQIPAETAQDMGQIPAETAQDGPGARGGHPPAPQAADPPAIGP